MAANPHWIAVSGSLLVDMPIWGGSVIWQGPLIFYSSRVCVCAVCCLLAFSTVVHVVCSDFLLAAPPHPSLLGKCLPPQFFHWFLSVTVSGGCRSQGSHGYPQCAVSMSQGSTFPFLHLPPSSSFGDEFKFSLTGFDWLCWAPGCGCKER